jgi:hypothetical protein
MPITTWKILLRRADQAGYHYVKTLYQGREPTEGEKIELRINGESVRGKVTEARKDVAGPGADAFTVMVDETC